MSYNPFAAALDLQRQTWENAAEFLARSREAPEVAEDVGSVEVGTTDSEVVYSENKLDLLHYAPRTDRQREVPILVVYALINRPYILDLQPDRSVVRSLLDQGFDVYLIDWGEPSNLDTSLGLEDYVTRYVDNCVDVVRSRSGRESISLLGYCMGGTMSAMYAALFPEKVHNLGLMAAGLCFDGTGGVLERWGDRQYYSPREVTDTFGNVPSEFLDVGFASMDPVENSLTKYVRFYENMDDGEFVENFARMERWIGDGIDVAGDAYVEFLEEVYQDNALYRNELHLGDRHVDVDRIDMPLLQIVAEYDHLIPPDASRPFNEVVGSDDTTLIEFPTGHIGMSVSSRSHDELWPRVGDWFADRSGDLVAVGPGGVGSDPEDPDHDHDHADHAEVGDECDAVAIEIEDGDGEYDGTGTGTREDDDADDGPALTDLDGVGPAYADRLRAAGVDSVSALAAADPAELADEVGVAASRVADWVDQAGRL